MRVCASRCWFPNPPIVIGEPLDVRSIVPFGLFEEILEECRGESLYLKVINACLGDGVVALQVRLYRGDRRGWRIFFEMEKVRALLTVRHHEQAVDGLTQFGRESPEHRVEKLHMRIRADVDDESFQDRRSWEKHARV